MGIKKVGKGLVLGCAAILVILIVIAPAGNDCGSNSPCTCGVACQGQLDPQSNGYNTIDSCIDGSNPKYEWVQDINVTDFNSSQFRTGHRVQVDVLFKCDLGEGDEVSINYYNGSVWRVINNGSCNINAYVHFRKNITLDKAVGAQAFRGVIAWGGIPTGMICGHDYDITYSDTDDVLLDVLSSSDTVGPTVSLIYPPNAASVVSRYMDFNFSVSDNSSVLNCSLWFNSTAGFKLNKSMTSGLNNHSQTYRFQVNLSDSSYRWNILCYDDCGNSAWSSANRTFGLDTHRPKVYYLPSTPSAPYLNLTSLVINVSAFDKNNVNLTLEFNGTNQTGVFQTYDHNISTVVKTGLAGTYSFKIFARDRYNNTNLTPKRTVTLDNAPPAAFDINKPANNTQGTQPIHLIPFLNWSWSFDQNFKNYTIEVSSNPSFAYRNYTYSVIGPFSLSHYQVSLTWTDQTIWYWRVWAFDLIGNARRSTNYFVFRANTSYPSVFLSSPLHNLFSNDESVVFTYTPRDSDLDQCMLWHNISGEFMPNETNSSPVSFQLNQFSPLSLPEGSFMWNVLCNDSTGLQSFASYEFLFTIHRTPPTVDCDSYTPDEGETVTNRTFHLGAEIIENYPDSLLMQFNGSNQSFMLNSSNFSINKTVTSDGSYSLRFFANDSAGNKGSTVQRNFVVDTSPPTISDIQVTPQIALPSKVFNVSATLSDLTGVLSAHCVLTMPNSTVHNYTMYGTSKKYYAYSGASVGNYSVVVCATDNNGFSGCNSTALIFTVDNSTILISNISTKPNSSDALDPNVVIYINTTIHSARSLASVLLKYKEHNSTAWSSSKSKEYIADHFVFNFTPTRGNNWTYKIWANNTLGKNVSSSLSTLQVWLDRTWTAQKSGLTSIAAPYGATNVDLGIILVNNTGDSQLTFNLSRVSGEVQVSFNLTDLFTIASKSSQAIALHASAPALAGSYPIRLRLDALNSMAQPSETTLNITLISYSSGPYVLVSIADYSNAVSVGENVPLLKASARNIGNSSCNDAYLVWSLPPDWTSRDSLNNSLGDIEVGAVLYSNISADVPESADTGTFSLLASLDCQDGFHFEDSRAITVSSSAPEPPQQNPASSSSGRGGGSIVTKTIRAKQPNLNLTAPSQVYAALGHSVNFTVLVSNEDFGIDNATLILTGYYLTHTIIEPVLLHQLAPAAQGKFKVNLFVPDYLPVKSYDLKLIVEAKLAGQNHSSRYSKDLILVVAASSMQDVANSLMDAQDDLSSLSSLGMDTTIPRAWLNQAMLSFNESDYSSASEFASKIHDLLAKAKQFTALIAEVRLQLAESASKGINLSLSNDLISIAEREFRSGRVDDALQTLSKASFAERLQVKTEQAKLVRSLVWFLHDNLLALSVVSLIAAAAFLLSYSKLHSVFIAKGLLLINKGELKAYEELRKLQRQYFVEKIISARLYAKNVQRLQERIAKLNYRRFNLTSKRKYGFKDKLAVQDEIQQLNLMQKELANKYYVLKTLDKASFMQLKVLCENRRAILEGELVKHV
ncbi:MAG: hypothetical protein V1837_02535 [Candidatus Woesearchaeota archaeon]